jgi:ComF family protein
MNLRWSCAARCLLDWLVPKDCLGCSTEVVGHGEWCDNCAEQLEPNVVTELDVWRLVVPFRHSGPLRHAIHRFKYEARPDYARRLVASAFAPQRPEFGSHVTLVPVPLHPIRLVERGYNQSALLAGALGRRWQLPVAFDLLARRVPTKPQVGQSRVERAANMRGAFVVRASPPKGHGVWLIDDVVTTGATASGCRAALAAAGIGVFGIIALAHATGGGSDAGS